jgi:hypothetical protein
MYLAELFRGYRHSEPTVLFGIRMVTMVMLLAALLGYLSFEVLLIKNDINPIITTSYVEADAIRAPSK